MLPLSEWDVWFHVLNVTESDDHLSGEAGWHCGGNLNGTISFSHWTPTGFSA